MADVVLGLIVLAAICLIAAGVEGALRQRWRAASERRTLPAALRRAEALLTALSPRILIGLSVVVFALIPPLLVIFDRWFKDETAARYFRESWCLADFLCRLLLPPYFLAVFACTLVVFVLVWLGTFPETLMRSGVDEPYYSPLGNTQAVPVLQRRAGLVLIVAASTGIVLDAVRRVFFGGVLGWDYALLLLGLLLGWTVREIPAADVARFVLCHHRTLALYVLAHIALLGTLAGYFSTHHVSAIPAALLVLSGIILLRRRREVHPLFWIVTLALFVYTLQVDAWTFSAVGDEFSFYDYAREIVEQHSLSFMGEHLFAGDAVYGAHPYLSSLIQALSMKLFDVQNFGWRFSSLYVTALSLPFFYAFSQTFVHRRPALLATFLLAASHYLMTFGKIGYNNTQALLALGLVLASAAWCIRSGRRIAYVLLGASIGFCFYVYPAALYAPLIALVLLGLYRPPRSRIAVSLWATMLLTTLVIVFPLVSQERYWASKVAGTFLYNPQLVSNAGTLLTNFVSNLLYAFYSFLYTPDESHFVTVAYVDALTAALVLLGLAWQFRIARRNRFAFFLSGSFGILVVLVGASHDRVSPSATRMFLVLPWFALFAALGLDWLAAQFRVLSSKPRAVRVLLTVFCLTILALNLFQAYVVSVRRSTGYQGAEELFLWLGQNIAAGAGEQPSLLLVNDPRTLHARSLQRMLQLYYLPISFSELRAMETTPGDARAALLAGNAIVVVSPRLPAEVQAEYEDFMKTNGHLKCAMKNLVGEWRFNVWYSPARPSPCPSRATQSIQELDQIHDGA